MATVMLEPAYRERMRELGLTTFAAVVNLPALMVGCHPARHVARVTLGHGPAGVRAFLKVERRVTWRDRLTSWWAGYGLVSKSVREARLLRALWKAGIACPDVIASGEDGRRGAFLLLREMTDHVDLRTFLHSYLPGDIAARKRFARELGATLARLHAAGFDHPDLYSKHVLVHPETRQIVLLDWQRSRRRRRLSDRRRSRDLAALDATLGDELAAPRERLRCLRAYLRSSGIPRRRWPGFLRRLRAWSQRLQGRRRVRELRQEALPAGTQDLVILEGGTVYAAPALHAQMTPQLWRLLRYAGLPPGARNCLEHTEVILSDGTRGLLSLRRVQRPRGWFWSWLRGRLLLSPEREQADVLFRLQRYGVPVPRLLAYGQRQDLPWRQESLLLVEAPVGAVPLGNWLVDCHDPVERRRVLHAAAVLLGRMHEAGCYFAAASSARTALLVRSDAEGTHVLLGSVHELRLRRQRSPRLASADLEQVRALLADAGCRDAEYQLLVRGYLNPHQDSNHPANAAPLAYALATTGGGEEA